LTVSASALKRSKASMAYCSAVLPMSPRLASRITGVSSDGLLVNVIDQCFELVFGALGGEVGDLRLERADQIGGGVDDSFDRK
jgi:hypothetical protein